MFFFVSAVRPTRHFCWGHARADLTEKAREFRVFFMT